MINKMKNIIMDDIMLFHLLVRKFRMATDFVNGVDFCHIVNYAIDQNSYECTDKKKSVHQVTLPSFL